MISAESDHFFARTALMHLYMGHVTDQCTKHYEGGFWAKNRIDLKRGYVKHVAFANKEVVFEDGTTLAVHAD